MSYINSNKSEWKEKKNYECHFPVKWHFTNMEINSFFALPIPNDIIVVEKGLEKATL